VSRSKRLGLGLLTGRLWEPPEGGDGLFQQICSCFDSLVFGLLLADVPPDDAFVLPYGRDEVSPRRSAGREVSIFRSMNVHGIWMALFPLMNPMTCDET
jgi:hypothetical protein